MADPEVLARGGELGDTKGMGHRDGAVPLPRKFLNFKSKNGAFCALLIGY